MRRTVLLLSLVLTACATNYDVYDTKQAVPTDRNLLYYALPRTTLRVTIPVEATKIDPPQCKDDVFLAAQRLELAQPNFKLGDVSITTFATPDPERVYAIDLPTKWLHKFTSTFELSEAGLLTNAQSTDENQGVDYGVGVLKIAAGLYGRIIGVGAANPAAAPVAADPCVSVQNDITGLQSARGLLIKQGISALTPPLPHDTLQLMLAEIDKRLESQIALFIGDVTKTSGTITCDLTPSSASVPSANETRLFTVQNGAIAVQHNRCFVPPALLGTVKGLTKSHDVRLTTITPQQFATSIKPRAAAGANGLYYRIPASTTVTVENTITTADTKKGEVQTITRTLLRNDALVAQFGSVNNLPRGADAHTFQSVVNATLTPSTGALQKLEFNITPKDTSTISNLADAAGLVLDAQSKRAAAAEAARKVAADELPALEQKRKILEEKKKIADLEKELGTPP